MTQSKDTPAEAASDAESDASAQCTAVGSETGEPCENPAILGTGLCHTHLDFEAHLGADDPVDEAGEDGRRLAADNNEITQMRSTSSPTRDGRTDGSLKNTPQGAAAKTGGSGR